MESPIHHRWFVALVFKLLEGDRPTLRLLARNPFAEKPPGVLRARLYRYRFSSSAERRQDGVWWVRTPVRDYLPPVGRSGPVDRRGTPSV
jgi:hypothetical protein